MPIAAAIAGSTLVSAYSANKAAGQAASAQKKGLQQSNALAQQAIGQAKDYFNIGQKSSQAGFQSALDFFKNAQASKYQPMIQGNVAAQKVIGQGAQQANNAILGLPVDMSFTNQQTAIQPNLSAVQSAQLPMLGAQQIAQQQPQIDQQNKQFQQQVQGQAGMSEADSRNYYNNLLGAK